MDAAKLASVLAADAYGVKELLTAPRYGPEVGGYDSDPRHRRHRRRSKAQGHCGSA